MYDLGLKIKAIRLERGLTQKELAQRINKSVSAVSSYESNAQVPPTDVLLSICQALHVSISTMVSINDSPGYSTESLTPDQRYVVDLLFQEFCTPSPSCEQLSARQIEIIQKIICLFSK